MIRLSDFPVSRQVWVFIVVAVMLPLLAQLQAAARVTRDAVIGEAERSLVNQVETLAQAIDAAHQLGTRSVELLATHEALVEYCAADVEGRAERIEDARNALRRAAGVLQPITGLGVLARDGTVLASTIEGIEGRNVGGRDYLSLARRDRAVVAEPFVTIKEAGGKLVVAYAIALAGPAEDRDCVLVMGRESNAIDLAGGSSVTGERAHVVVTDRLGIRIAHSLRPDFLMTPSGPVPEAELARMAAIQRFGPDTARLLREVVPNPVLFAQSVDPEFTTAPPVHDVYAPANEQDNVLVSRRLATTHWTVSAAVPLVVVTAPADRAVGLLGLLGLASLLMAVAIGVAGARGIARRLEKIAAVAARVRDGGLDERVVDDGRDELGLVATQFNAMVDKLREDRDVLEARVQERTSALQAANAELSAQGEELRAQGEELRAQRDELVAQQAALEQKNAEVEKANRLKSEFLSNMSHELRTPLNAVIGFTELLLDEGGEPLTDRQRRYLADVRNAGKHQLALINDILDLSKIEAGQFRLDLAAVPVRESIERASTVIGTQLRARNVTVAVDCPPNLMALADERRLLQVLLNLLANAAKWSPEGGTIDVTVRVDGKLLVLDVADRGPGVPDEMWSRLFQPFQQAESPLEKTHQGTGLGLAICRRLVELHGGSIAAAPRPGGGLVIRFSLPLSSAQERTPPPRPLVERKPIDPELVTERIEAMMLGVAPPGRRVLVIDDDPVVSRVLAHVLRDRGFVVRAAESGQAGLDAAREMGPNLAVVDLQLPDIPGADVIRALRSTPEGRKLPVIVLTAADLSPADIAALRALDAAVALKGEVSARELVAGVEHALRTDQVATPTGPAVLVVDDNDMNRSLLRALLERHGLRTIEASNAAEGLDLARRAKPAVVLMDLAMPGMDGFAAIETLKADPATAHLPVVAVTALALRRDEERARAAGADAYVTKPIDGAQLMKTVLALAHWQEA